MCNLSNEVCEGSPDPLEMKDTSLKASCLAWSPALSREGDNNLWLIGGMWSERLVSASSTRVQIAGVVCLRRKADTLPKLSKYCVHAAYTDTH